MDKDFEDFKFIELKPPMGGLYYMKRIEYLNDPEYADFPQFIIARGRENGIAVFDAESEGERFIKEMSQKEFDKVFEID